MLSLSKPTPGIKYRIGSPFKQMQMQTDGIKCWIKSYQYLITRCQTHVTLLSIVNGLCEDLHYSRRPSFNWSAESSKHSHIRFPNSFITHLQWIFLGGFTVKSWEVVFMMRQWFVDFRTKDRVFFDFTRPWTVEWGSKPGESRYKKTRWFIYTKNCVTVYLQIILKSIGQVYDYYVQVNESRSRKIFGTF